MLLSQLHSKNMMYLYFDRDMQEKPLEGDSAGKAEETDKLWKFTEEIIKEADKKRAENKVSQSEQEPEITDKSGEKEVGQGDKKND